MAKIYSTSLLITTVMVPVFASFITVGLYLTLPNSPLPPLLGLQPSSPCYTVVYGSILTVIVWLVVAIPFCYFSTARGARPSDYSLLKSRLHQLKASLGLEDSADGSEKIDEIKTMMKKAGWDVDSTHKWGALKEAYACCIDTSQKLSTFSVGLPWTIGIEYNSAWSLLHHAEEVIIEVTDAETVVREAKHDFLAIRDSQMSGKDELLGDVRQAICILLPEALPYFQEPQPSKSSRALSQLTQPIDQSGPAPQAANASSKNSADPKARAQAEAVARTMLRVWRNPLR